jgi:hypothetical protein
VSNSIELISFECCKEIFYPPMSMSKNIKLNFCGTEFTCFIGVYNLVSNSKEHRMWEFENGMPKIIFGL